MQHLPVFVNFANVGYAIFPLRCQNCIDLIRDQPWHNAVQHSAYKAAYHQRYQTIQCIGTGFRVKIAERVHEYKGYTHHGKKDMPVQSCIELSHGKPARTAPYDIKRSSKQNADSTSDSKAKPGKTVRSDIIAKLAVPAIK